MQMTGYALVILRARSLSGWWVILEEECKWEVGHPGEGGAGLRWVILGEVGFPESFFLGGERGCISVM